MDYPFHSKTNVVIKHYELHQIDIGQRFMEQYL